MDRSSHRIPSLDGLRTLSIALVMFAHFLISMGIVDRMSLGNLGVRIFFVISGFLITGLLLKEIEKTNTINLVKFYLRRTIRIFPPYYFFLLVLLCLSGLGYIQISRMSFSMAFAYATDYYKPDNWHLGHTWSLSVEEQFYLLFPGILLFLSVRKTKILLLLVVLFSPLIRMADYWLFGESLWSGIGFHFNMDALGLGCLLSLFHSRLHQNSYYQRFLTSKIVYLLPLLILSGNIFADRPRIFAVSTSIMNISIALCIDWVVTNYDTLPGKLLNSAPMVYLGTMSYSIYLWQQLFFDKADLIWTKFPLNFLGLAVMSLISYYLIEKSALIFRQSLEPKIFKKRAEFEPTGLAFGRNSPDGHQPK